MHENVLKMPLIMEITIECGDVVDPLVYNCPKKMEEEATTANTVKSPSSNESHILAWKCAASFSRGSSFGIRRVVKWTEALRTSWVTSAWILRPAPGPTLFQILACTGILLAFLMWLSSRESMRAYFCSHEARRIGGPRKYAPDPHIYHFDPCRSSARRLLNSRNYFPTMTITCRLERILQLIYVPPRPVSILFFGQI